jgi:predicted ABC-type ATPase
LLHDKKTAFIIAGPNGSGKTTFSISLIKHTKILTGMHLNADIILKANENEDFLKDLTPLEQHLKVSSMIDKKIDELIESGENLILETVFSSPYKLQTFQKLKDAGYFINMIFVSTQDPLINVQNVALRVEKGGHTVPIDKILKRYKGSHENLNNIVQDIDCLILIDNSTINKPPIIHTALSNGSKCFIDTEHKMAEWIQQILDKTDDMIEDETKIKVCNQIQSVLDEKFVDLVEMDIDDLLSELEK